MQCVGKVRYVTYEYSLKMAERMTERYKKPNRASTPAESAWGTTLPVLLSSNLSQRPQRRKVKSVQVIHGDEYRVIVCGGRDYRNRVALWAELDAIHAARTITLLVDGGAKGADSLAHAWALSRGVPTKRFFARWDIHGKLAGRIRNAEQLDKTEPHLVVATPGNEGTGHMMMIAMAAGVKLHLIPAWPIEV